MIHRYVTKCGVFAFSFYILTAGAAGTNNATNLLDRDTYDVTGIGMRKSAEIAYLVERDFLTANSTFADESCFYSSSKFFILC
jgi:hypothetical protein